MIIEDNKNKLVKKRDGSLKPFELFKIETAIMKAMDSIGARDEKMAGKIARIIERNLYRGQADFYAPHVDEIHDKVENELMDCGLNYVAKNYILFRSEHKPSIFKKRVSIKPYEYPELYEYVEAIRQSYWVHDEFNYTSDIQDMKVHVSEKEKTAIVRAMLAISQIENAVKTFWGDIYKKLPKPEIGKVGATFSESEVRHEDAYSNLIELLGLNKEFDTLLQVPCIRRRMKYLDKSLANAKSIDNREYFESVVLFSMFIENVSLFSQFLVIMSFNKHRNLLKGMSNAVEATSKEETLHAEFGFDLVNIIKRENPTWWTPELVEDLVDATLDAYDAEADIVDWIFEQGDLDFLTKEQTLEFIKDRFNRSLESIGIEKIFLVDQDVLKSTEWFDDEILTTKHTDFFNKRSINYTKRGKPVTENDLF